MLNSVLLYSIIYILLIYLLIHILLLLVENFMIFVASNLGNTFPKYSRFFSVHPIRTHWRKDLPCTTFVLLEF